MLFCRLEEKDRKGADIDNKYANNLMKRYQGLLLTDGIKVSAAVEPKPTKGPYRGHQIIMTHEGDRANDIKEMLLQQDDVAAFRYG